MHAVYEWANSTVCFCLLFYSFVAFFIASRVLQDIMFENNLLIGVVFQVCAQRVQERPGILCCRFWAPEPLFYSSFFLFSISAERYAAAGCLLAWLLRPFLSFEGKIFVLRHFVTLGHDIAWLFADWFDVLAVTLWKTWLLWIDIIRLWYFPAICRNNGANGCTGRLDCTLHTAIGWSMSRCT